MSAARSSLNKKKCNCGATGCVIFPGEDCGDSPCVGDKCKKKVTKIFFGDKNLKAEIAIFDINEHLLHQLDPNEDFFLSSYKKCHPVDESKVLADCKGQFKSRYLQYSYFFPEKKNTPIPAEEAGFEDEEADDITYSESNRRIQRNNERRDIIERKKRELKIKPKEKTFNTININYLGTDMETVMEEIKAEENVESKMEKIKVFLVAVENIFQGIKILNRNDFYHCDIKPKNVVLDKDNKFKIIDFGIAFYKTPKIQENVSSKAEKGMEGLTPGFSSPEYYDLMRNDYIQGLTDTEKYSYLMDFGNNDIQGNSNEIKFTLTLPGIDKPIKGEKKNIDYYIGLNQRDRYSKNDIWALGYVLKYIYKEIYDMNPDEFANILNGLRVVISELLVLDVAKRPTPDKALCIYQAFLIENELIENRSAECEKQVSSLARKSVGQKSMGGKRFLRKTKRQLRKTTKRLRKTKRQLRNTTKRLSHKKLKYFS